MNKEKTCFPKDIFVDFEYKSVFPEGVEAIILTKDNYNDMVNKLQYENIQLKERINKAREYIENNLLYEEIYDYDLEDILELKSVSDEKATNELLDILKGE